MLTTFPDREAATG